MARKTLVAVVDKLISLALDSIYMLTTRAA